MGLLLDLAAFFNSIPFLWKLIGHCLVVSSWFPQNKDKFLLNYWTALLGAFGGGMLSAVLLQKPDRAGIALLDQNEIGLVWTLCWWVINYSPGDIGSRLHSLLPVRLVTKACMNMLRAGIIANRVDLTEELFPGVIAAPLFIGTVAASGGKLCLDLIQQLSGNLTGASEVAEPGFALRTGFFGSLAYWLLVYFLGVLKTAEGAALITLAFVLHGVASDLVGQQLDFTQPVAKALHTITLVPMPGSRQPRKTVAATEQAKSKKTK